MDWFLVSTVPEAAHVIVSKIHESVLERQVAGLQQKLAIKRLFLRNPDAHHFRDGGLLEISSVHVKKFLAWHIEHSKHIKDGVSDKLAEIVSITFGEKLLMPVTHL